MAGEQHCFALLTELVGATAAKDLAPYGLVQLLEMDPEALIRLGASAESGRLLGIIGRIARYYAGAVLDAKGDPEIGELVTGLRRAGMVVYYLADETE